MDVSSTSYYSVLGVSTQSSDEEIRRAYHKLAMQWHPDKWTRNPSLLGEAKQKFQEIQEAYSVLSDRGTRTLYDAGLYDPDYEEEDIEVEGFTDFVQEMVSLMKDVRKEDKNCSMEELQSMFWDMANSFDWSNNITTTTSSSKSVEQPQWQWHSWEQNMFQGNIPQYSEDLFKGYGTHHFCT